jgi:hypothetical protein
LLGPYLEVGHRVDAEVEPDIAGLVPAVEVFGLSEVGVAPEDDQAKTGLAAQVDCLVEVDVG